jgi:hypothetical protein
MYNTREGVAFAIVFFVYYGEVTLRAIRGLYNTNIAQKMRAIGAFSLCYFSVPLEIGYGQTLSAYLFVF